MTNDKWQIASSAPRSNHDQEHEDDDDGDADSEECQEQYCLERVSKYALIWMIDLNEMLWIIEILQAKVLKVSALY